MELLPDSVKRSVEALKAVQVEHNKLQTKYKLECLELEKKYLELQKPLYERRRAIVAGDAKPTSEEIVVGIEEAKKDKEEYEAVAVEGDTSAIPEFWLTTLRNHPGITELITDRDVDALKALTDIQISYLPADSQAGYKLLFHFKPNDYFTNEVLEKTYLYQAEVGYTGDFIYDKAVGTEINWKAEKDLTKTFEIKKQRNKNTNRTRLVRKAKPTESFFSFFSPVSMPSEEEIEKNGMDDDELELIEKQIKIDYRIGTELKEKVIPRAIDYFTGKALDYEDSFDDDSDDDEDSDEDDDDEDNDDDEDEDNDDDEDEDSGGDDVVKDDHLQAGTETLMQLTCRCHDTSSSSDAASRLSMQWDPDSVITQSDQEQRVQDHISKRRSRALDAERVALERGITLFPTLREVSIYSDEDGSAELEVPLQAKYTGTEPVIGSSLASVPCATLGPDKLLERLNETLRTTYTATLPGLSSHLQACIDNDYDFGMAFARLRPYWYTDFESLQERLDTLEAKDREMRMSALQKDSGGNVLVTSPYIGPRRVWDLYSNRVVPTWTVPMGEGSSDIWGVSHSWMSEEHRHNIETPINGHEWPVPLPIDTTLERVRIELLNYGAEYIWLDVLCLRQECSGNWEKEMLRAEEWKLDVPTIGGVYFVSSQNVTYLSGLGRPFRVGDLDSERHWLNRAWTLQEVHAKTINIIGGLDANSPVPRTRDDRDWFLNADSDVKLLYTRLQAMRNLRTNDWYTVDNLLPTLEIMRVRAAVHEIDKIAGIGYFLWPYVLPAYIYTNADSAGEDAWTRHLETMNSGYRGHLLFLYPAPGLGRYAWAPSWKQIKETPGHIPRTDGIHMFEKVELTMGENPYYFYGHLLEKCMIQGLEKPNLEGYCRRGILKVAHEGVEHCFTVTAHHQQPIPEAVYDLMGNTGGGPWAGGQDPRYKCWVVGQLTDSGNMHKVSVVRMDSGKEQRRLKKLGLTSSKTKVTLV